MKKRKSSPHNKSTFISLVHAIFVLSLTSSVTNASASAIFFDDFGTGSNAGRLTNIGSNWAVTAGNVDLWNFFGSEGRSLDLDGTASNGTIQSVKLSLSAGNMYELSFSYGNNTYANNILRFAVGSLLDETLPISTVGTPSYTTITRQFAVSSSTSASIVFKELGIPNSGGSVIDNVLLQDLGPISVSAPSTLVLLVLGLLSFRFVRVAA